MSGSRRARRRGRSPSSGSRSRARTRSCARRVPAIARSVKAKSACAGFAACTRANSGCTCTGVSSRATSTRLKRNRCHYRPGSKIFSIATTGCNWLCHPAGTSILMADGTNTPVEDIRPGDRLWSYNIDGGYQILPSVVTHVGERLDWIYQVRVGSRGSSLLEATADHPVLTQRGWVLVRNLAATDRILKVWYQNTSAWKASRAASIVTADFTCGVCGDTINGLSAWNRHRGECYTKDAVYTAEDRLNRSERMRARNPMRDPEIARRVSATSKARYEIDPTHGWHRNLARLDAWRHRHPSVGQERLYGILESMGIRFEREYRIQPDQRLRGSKKFYV